MGEIHAGDGRAGHEPGEVPRDGPLVYVLGVQGRQRYAQEESFICSDRDG
jgi:hypothetical protein